MLIPLPKKFLNSEAVVFIFAAINTIFKTNSCTLLKKHELENKESPLFLISL